MKEKLKWKRILSVLLSTAMVLGMISIPSQRQVEAAGDNLITNGGFDTASSAWRDQDNELVGAQEVVDDVIVHEIVTNGDFQAGNYQSGVNGWQCRGGATLSVINDSTDQTNKVLQVEATAGGAQANFYFGQAGILEVGKTYTVSFDVKQTAGSGGFTKYSDSVVGGWTSHLWEAPSSEWRKIEYEITPSQSTAWAQIGIQFDTTATFCIDNFSIAWKETKMENVTEDIVENGDFEEGNYQSGVNGWQCRSGAELSVINDSTDQTNKVLQVEATAGGAQANFYFGQAGILEVGKTYTVSFDVKQTAGNGGFTKYSDSVVGGWTSHLWEASSSEWRKIEYEITPTQSTAWAQIGIQFDAAATFCIDNFSITYDGGRQVAKTYTDGIGTCNEAENGNVLAMKSYTKVTQPVAIKTGNQYDYSFMVKSKNVGEDFTFGVTAGGNETTNVNVTSDWTEVKGSFTATTDATEFGFTRGGTGTVLIDDVILNKTSNRPTDHTPNVEAIPEGKYDVLQGMNGDFASDTMYEKYNGVVIEHGYAKVTEKQTIHHKTGVNLVKGENYKLVFYAQVRNASEDASINVFALEPGWHNHLTPSKTLTDLNNLEEWTKIEIDYTAVADGVTQFGFQVNEGTAELYVDDLMLLRDIPTLTEHTSMPGGGYYIPLEDAVNLNTVGDFSGSTGWNGSGYVIQDGMGSVNEAGKWLQTQSFELIKDHTYTISAYVWVTNVDSSITFDCFSGGDAAPGGDWTDWGMENWRGKGATCNRTASLTGNTYGWELVTLTWTAPADGTCYFGFKIYNGAGTVYIDDVALYDHAVPQYVDVKLTYAGSEYANNDFTIYVNNSLTEEQWSTNYPSSEGTIPMAGSVWINDVEYTDVNYFFNTSDKKIILWNVATNSRVNPADINKVEIKAGTKLAFSSHPMARITKGFVIEKNEYGQWVDPTNTNTGANATLTFGSFDYYATKMAALSGMPESSGENVALSGAVRVNGVNYGATFTHNGNSVSINFDSGTLQDALSETEENTVVIPKDLVLYEGVNAVCKMSADTMFYVQKKNDVWMSWTQNGYLTEDEHIQYFDMGTEGTTYTFNNNADATYMGVLTVTGKETFALAKGGNSSKEVTALGDYFVSRTIKGEKFDYTVALYKRGDADQTMDGTLTVKDLVGVKKAVAAEQAKFGYARYKAADTNTDGVVDAEDAAFMRHILAGGYDISTTTSKGYSTLGQGVMPIIGYNGPSDHSTMTNQKATKRSTQNGIDNLLDGEDGERVFGLVKELGINVFSSMVHEVGDQYEDSSRMLKMADKYGLGVYLNNAYLTSDVNSEITVANQLSPQTAKYESFGSFHGYYIADEPTKNEIGNSENALSLMKKHVNIATYFNLFPNWDPTKVSGDYPGYLQTAFDTSAETVSYDLYLRAKAKAVPSIRTADFYKNLDQARTASMNANKPFQAFVQTGANWIDKSTDKVDSSNKVTIQEMYLEANAALAMGAKGIHYFSLIESANQVAEGDNDSGLITINGQKNNNNNEGGDYAYYDAAKKINTYIAKIDEVLMNATNKNVITRNSDIKSNISNVLDSYGAIGSVTGSEYMIGCFDYYGKEAYFIVNVSPDGGGTGSEQNITLNFTSPQTGRHIGMGDTNWNTMSSTPSQSFRLPAGESVLVVLD